MWRVKVPELKSLNVYKCYRVTLTFSFKARWIQNQKPVIGLSPHQSQQVFRHVFFYAVRRNVTLVQATLQVESLTEISHGHQHSQKSHQRRCVHDCWDRRQERCRWQKLERRRKDCFCFWSELQKLLECGRRSHFVPDESSSLRWVLANLTGVSVLGGAYIPAIIVISKSSGELKKDVTVHGGSRDWIREEVVFNMGPVLVHLVGSVH